MQCIIAETAYSGIRMWARKIASYETALIVRPEDGGNCESGCRLRREAGNRIAIDKPFCAYLQLRKKGCWDFQI